MSRLLSGVTHAIVTVPKRADATAGNTYAAVDLCFGPGDSNAISGLRYMKGEDGKMIWQGPLIQLVQDGRTVSLPVLKGSLLLEAARLASAAVARINKDLGKSAWGTRYRILKDQVLIEDQTKE